MKVTGYSQLKNDQDVKWNGLKYRIQLDGRNIILKGKTNPFDSQVLNGNLIGSYNIETDEEPGNSQIGDVLKIKGLITQEVVFSYKVIGFTGDNKTRLENIGTEILKQRVFELVGEEGGDEAGILSKTIKLKK